MDILTANNLIARCGNTEDFKLSAHHRLVLLILLTYTNYKRDNCFKCWPSNEQLMMGIGSNSEGSIKRHLNELEAMGFIRRETKQIKGNKRQRVIYISLDRLVKEKKQQDLFVEEKEEVDDDVIW